MIEPFWNTKNIFFSSISFILIYKCLITNNRKTKRNLLAFETILWISKLMVFKGGYVTGFGGTPLLVIVIYDLISITIRLFLLFQLINNKKIHLISVSLFVIIVMSIKISKFDYPLSMAYYEIKSIEEAQEMRKKIIGKWKGQVLIKKDSNNISSETKQNVILRIDKNAIYLDNIEELDSEYKMTLEYSNYGYIRNETDYSHLDLFINEITDEKLKFDLNKIFKTFTFDLRKIENGS